MFNVPPILLHYYILYRCNCRCSFCDIWASSRFSKNSFARLADVRKNLRQVRSLGVRFVDFTGGEPLLHPKLPHMLHAAKSLGLQTSVTTNCLLYPQKAKDMTGLVDFLHFSIDACNPDIHDKLRGRPAFKHVLDSIKVAKNCNERPDLLFTVTAENYHELPSLIKMAQSAGLLFIVNPVFSHFNQRILNNVALSFIDSFKNEKNVYINRALHRLIRQGGNRISAPRCRVVDSTIVISPDNHVLLPCFHFYQKKIPIEQDLRLLRKLPVFKKYRYLQGKLGFCQGCTINCYFDPSFHYKLDIFLFESLAAKAKYAWEKYKSKK